MIDKVKKIYRNLSLTDKIRFSYLTILIPMIVLVIICLLNLWISNVRYKDMIESAVVAGEFSLDFKEDFDYETYLLVVENKSIEESDVYELLDSANGIVDRLYELTEDESDETLLKSAKQYLVNLRKYIERIELNLSTGNRYEENMVIWENDVQIVTGLLSETLNEYIYSEIRDIQHARDQLEHNSLMIIIITLIGAFVLIVFSIFFSIHIPRSITRPIYEIMDVTRQVAAGDLSVRTHIEYEDEVKTLGESLNIMIDKIENLLDQVTVEQIRLRHAELELLQAQINPHFLYNTLDTIVWLAETGDQDRVISMVGSLSKFFRTSLNQGKDNISIGEELEHARSYLEIQQVRYQDILSYEIDVPRGLYGYTIPKITIQPLVENALYHGIKNKRGMGHIRVTGEKHEDHFYITVTDDGIGMTKERLKQIRDRISDPEPDSKDIFGLYNVNERIRLRAGDEYGIEVDSTYGEGTTVRIKLPNNIPESMESLG
ncbi:MAG: sensor histidine kinase [Lachnospiraceae bacterium]|nr:sensor histidine kinase [Lachnospiraceae bacterium]